MAAMLRIPLFADVVFVITMELIILLFILSY